MAAEFGCVCDFSAVSDCSGLSGQKTQFGALRGLCTTIHTTVCTYSTVHSRTTERRGWGDEAVLKPPALNDERPVFAHTKRPELCQVINPQLFDQGDIVDASSWINPAYDSDFEVAKKSAIGW